jgi:hypothetical protein
LLVCSLVIPPFVITDNNIYNDKFQGPYNCTINNKFVEEIDWKHKKYYLGYLLLDIPKLQVYGIVKYVVTLGPDGSIEKVNEILEKYPLGNIQCFYNPYTENSYEEQIIFEKTYNGYYTLIIPGVLFLIIIGWIIGWLLCCK